MATRSRKPHSVPLVRTGSTRQTYSLRVEPVAVGKVVLCWTVLAAPRQSLAGPPCQGVCPLAACRRLVHSDQPVDSCGASFGPLSCERSMKIYTRTGDLGETGLFGGPRVGKDMARIEAFGTVDELNAVLGVARSETLPDNVEQILQRTQMELSDLGAELASPDPVKQGTRKINREHLATLETEIDQFEGSLPPLDQFILPGGSRAAAQLHLARTVCRRAERRLVTLVRHSQDEISLLLLAYLNRLSDLLFVLARLVA